MKYVVPSRPSVQTSSSLQKIKHKNKPFWKSTPNPPVPAQSPLDTYTQTYIHTYSADDATDSFVRFIRRKKKSQGNTNEERPQF